MPRTFQSVRFGAVEVPDSAVLEFPLGLVGLGGLHYALIDRNPGTGFLWLHSVEDAALALPVVSPYQFFSDFQLEIDPSDQERTGIASASAESILVTVRATPDPLDITANLRAPIVIEAGQGFQVLNNHEQAHLQAPLFTLAEPAESAQPLDAA